MKKITIVGMALATGMALAGWAGAADSWDADGDADYVVITASTDLASLGVKDQGSQEVTKAIRAALAGKPPETKARILLGATTEGSSRWQFVYLRSIVLLDAEGRLNGEERLVTHQSISGAVGYRLTPWKSGVKDGMEREFLSDVLRGEVPWKAGKMEGVRKTFFASGQLEAETEYAGGVANGFTRTYDETGNLAREGTMKQGKRDGKMTDYWEGARQPKRVAHFQNGKAEGRLTEYYLSGNLKREASLKDDSLHGVEKQYEEDGKASLTRYWLNGDGVTEEDFKKGGGK